MPAFALRLLGSLQLHGPHGEALALGARRVQQLLAVLGWHGSQGCSTDDGWVQRDDLSALLWPDTHHAQARTNLRKLLLELRQTGLATPEEDPGRLRWRPGSDVDAFAAAHAAGHWQLAAELGSGNPFDGLDAAGTGEAWQAWLQTQRNLHQQRWRAVVVKALASATPAQAQALAGLLLKADPQDGAAQKIMQDQAAGPGLTLAPLAPWVGREVELRQLLALLRRRRLVTVLGLGGVGKSRLARHAADALDVQGMQRKAVVVLSDLNTPAALAGRIADTLGELLPPHADSAQALMQLLAGRSLLLVLDGFEAIVDAAALLPRLLAAAPGLRLLVTSRERLDVDGEYLFPLDSLAVPAADATAQQTLQSPAVRLFCARARAVRPHFDAPACWAALGLICRQLGGLPLAIEWAAALTRVLSAEALAHDITTDPTLHGEAGPLGVLESSWRQLTHRERQAYAALAVFRGGFTREAAQQVAGVGLQQLAALVDQSLLRSRADGVFELHPLAHAHAHGKLAGSAQAPTLAAQHGRWYLKLLHRRGPLPVSEHQNLLAAWRRAVAEGDAGWVNAALVRMRWSLLFEGRTAEAVAVLESAEARFGSTTPTGAHLQARRSWLLLWLDDDEQACALAQQAAPVLQAGGCSAGLMVCLRTQGHAAQRACLPERAAAHFRQGLNLPEADDGMSQRAALHDALGTVLLQLGDLAGAAVQFDCAQAFNIASGDEAKRIHNHFNRAQVHAAAGQPEAALPLARTALALNRGAGLRHIQPYLHAQMARVLVALGRRPEAQRQAGQALLCARETGDPSAQVWALEATAQAALLQGDTVAARQALTTALRCSLRTQNLALGPLLLPTALRAFSESAVAAGWAQLPGPQLLRRLAQDVVAPRVRRTVFTARTAPTEATGPAWSRPAKRPGNAEGTRRERGKA